MFVKVKVQVMALKLTQSTKRKSTYYATNNAYYNIGI